MTTGDPTTPDDDETVQTAVFLLELGGAWTTDCGCITVIDGTRQTVRLFSGNLMDTTQWNRYIAVYDHTAPDGLTGIEILTAAPTPCSLSVRR